MQPCAIFDYLEANQRFRPVEILGPENCGLVEIDDEAELNLYHMSPKADGSGFEFEEYDDQ